ncbi:condensation domain-containing protein [Alteromonadaceae bacterium 2753L.S.0a.02]|nr:condensation domain-containing protein [Alteromonadaceae bacterium 2753L.S.0a.02]
MEYPLSFCQQRIWIFSQLTNAISVYNVPFFFDVTRGLDEQCFRHAVAKLLERHEVLRTTYHHRDFIPYQKIEEASKFQCDYYDYSDIEEPNKLQKLEELTQLTYVSSFDLQLHFPLRIALIKVSQERYRVLFVFNHIAIDGWSIAIFNKDLSEFYNSFLENREPQLEPLLTQYRDYAAAQRDRLDAATSTESFDFWKAQLHAPLKELYFADLPKCPGDPVKGKTIEFEFERPLSESLLALAKRSRVSMYSMMLAAFKLSLYVHNDCEDIIVGSPFANRHHEGVENLIGFFVNTLPVRTKLNPEESVSDLARKIQLNIFKCFKYQEQPIEPLLNFVKNQVEQLIHCMFSVQDISKPALLMKGVESIPVSVPIHGSKYDITVVFYCEPGCVRGEIEYKTEIFSEKRINQIVDQLTQVCKYITTDLESETSLLSVKKAIKRQNSEDSHVILENIRPVLERCEPSYEQKVLFHQHRFHKDLKYIISSTRLYTEINSAEILKKAYSRLIDEEKILRAGFVQSDSSVVLNVHEQGHVNYIMQDIRGELPSLQKAFIKKTLEEQSRKSVNLEKDHLIRCFCFRLSSTSYVVSILCHHIVVDDISFSLLLDRFHSLVYGNSYPRISESSYLDYIRHSKQRHRLSSSEESKNIPVGNAFSWILDFESCKGKPSTDITIEREFAPNENAALLKMAKQHKATPFVIGLACFGVLVSRFSDAIEFNVITENGSGRNAGFEPVIGPIIRWDSYRFCHHNNTAPEPVISAIKEQYFRYFSEDAPQLFDVDDIKAPYAPIRLFFGMKEYASTKGEARTGLSEYLSPLYEARYELSLHLVKKPSGFCCAITFDNRVLSHATVERMSQAYCSLLLEAQNKPISIEKRYAEESALE